MSELGGKTALRIEIVTELAHPKTESGVAQVAKATEATTNSIFRVGAN